MSSRGRGRASASRGEGGSGPGPAGRSGARSRAPVAPSRPPHESTLRGLIEDQPSSSREGKQQTTHTHTVCTYTIILHVCTYNCSLMAKFVHVVSRIAVTKDAVCVLCRSV